MPKTKHRNKKKVNHQQLVAQRRNDYKRKIIRLAKLVGAEEALPWISKADWEQLCNTRFRAIRIEAGNDLVPKQLLTTARKQMDQYLSEQRVSFVEGGYEMSYKEYIAVALHMYYYVTDKKNPCPIIVKEKFAKLIEAIEGVENSPLNLLMTTSNFVSIQMSRMHRRMYFFRHQIEAHDFHVNESLYLYGFQHHKRKLRIRDTTRLAYRVGWCTAEQGITWAEVIGAQFGYDNEWSNLPVRVYVQAHALQRLKERVDLIHNSYLQFYLYLSIQDLVVVRTESGQQLIEFHYSGKKLGYFAFDLLGKNLIIRTFLFITMDGTPEGDVLREKLGIEAEDKKYLSIDKLSTFIISDIKSNPEVKQHFIDAGCGQLFEWEGVDFSQIEEMEHATKIESYLSKARAYHSEPSPIDEPEEALEDNRIMIPDGYDPLLLPQSCISA
jgi:hypothetical protein